MNLAEDYFSKNHFFKNNFSEIQKNSEMSAQILFFPQVFRRHHVLSDPINYIDLSGNIPVPLISGAVGAFFGGLSGAMVGYYNGEDSIKSALIGAGTGFAIGSGAALFSGGAAAAGVGLGGQVFAGGIGGSIFGFSGSTAAQTTVTGKLSLREASGAAFSGASGGMCGPALGAAGDFATGIVLFPFDILWGARR